MLAGSRLMNAIVLKTITQQNNQMKKLLIILCVFYSAVCSAQIKGGDASRYTKQPKDTSRPKWFTMEPDYVPSNKSVRESWWISEESVFNTEELSIEFNSSTTGLHRLWHMTKISKTLYIDSSTANKMFDQSDTIIVANKVFISVKPARTYPGSLPYKWMIN